MTQVFLRPMRTTFPFAPLYSIVSPRRSTPSLKRRSPEITLLSVVWRASETATASTAETVSPVKRDERPEKLRTSESTRTSGDDPQAGPDVSRDCRPGPRPPCDAPYDEAEDLLRHEYADADDGDCGDDADVHQRSYVMPSRIVRDFGARRSVD